jgi:aldehyde dehydrogenase (NAD+)
MPLSFDPSALRPSADHFIAGRRVSGGDAEIAVLRPSDLMQATILRDAGEPIVDLPAKAAAEALQSSGWAKASPRERARVLHRWAELVEARGDDLARLESLGSTRPIADTATRDVVRTAGVIRYYAEFADKIEGAITATDADSTCMVMAEPYGVVGAIVPWNFPIINTAWKCAPALSAGNAVVVKPSELTPLSAVALAELAIEAGLPAGLFNVVQGLGPTTGTAVVRHPLIQKISFTGSTETGAKIMAEAALHGTKPVTLELGGKSPQLVLKDVRGLDTVAQNVANGFLYNAGQVCTAGSRLIVHRAQADELVERVITIAKSRKPGPTWHEDTSLSPIVSERQAKRLETLLSRTLAEGAMAITGGKRHSAPNAGIYFEPTVLANVSEDSTGFRDEFFGPVMSVHPYEDEEQAIAMANHPVYGLAASLYTDDARKALSVPRRIEAGVVWINAHGRQPEYTAPQGGFRQSGFGKDMGRAGLEGYLRYKTLWYAHG